MGGELLGDILPRYQLDVYNIHAYSSIIREIHTKSVDFVLAYTQDDLKTEISMDPPKVLDLKGTTQ